MRNGGYYVISGYSKNLYGNSRVGIMSGLSLYPKKRNMKSVHFLIGSLFMLAMQSIFLTLTGSVTEILWIPCMMIAAGMMYGFLWSRKYEASGSGLLLCPCICSCRVCSFAAVADGIYCTGSGGIRASGLKF